MDIVNAWKTIFKNCTDIEISCGDIFDIEADAIISPANSFGFMDGGIDQVYSDYFGWDLQNRLQKIIREKHFGEIPVGIAEIIETGNKNIKYLISAPTMRIPCDVSKTVNAYLAFRASLIEIKMFNKKNTNKIESVLCPGLGTMIGLMPPTNCAIQMKYAYDSILKQTIQFPEELIEAYKTHNILIH
jgi:O-acetyl-ADP-ribose deacetylase (regulator of RNase III)